MYNRYIPQPDGSYRRNRMQDSQQPVSPQPACVGSNDTQREGSNVSKTGDRIPHRSRSSAPVPAGSFLRQILPGNLDTEDLLVVVLLLLMAGDCEENRNTALLTLALYLFL